MTEHDSPEPYIPSAYPLKEKKSCPYSFPQFLLRSFRTSQSDSDEDCHNEVLLREYVPSHRRESRM